MRVLKLKTIKNLNNLIMKEKSKKFFRIVKDKLVLYLLNLNDN